MSLITPTWDRARLVFLDETGITTNLLRRYGPAPVRTQVPTPVPSSRTSAGQRTALTWWCELWEARWPEGIPQMAEGKTAHLARIETQLGVDELSRRMARYLADDDDWLLQHKHPVGGFIARINSYDDVTARPSSRIRNCPQCHAPEREHDDRCAYCDWTRAAWEARESGDD